MRCSSRPGSRGPCSGGGAVEPAQDGDQLFWWGTVGRVRGEVKEYDPAVPVEDGVGAELPRVVTTRHADALAGEERAHPGARDAGAQHPEWLGTAGAERLVERSFRVGDHERASEGELVTPGRRSDRTLRCDHDEPTACGLDLGNGLHDTVEVGAADVSAGVPREVHDGRMPEQVALGDVLSVGILELEGGELLHVAMIPEI